MIQSPQPAGFFVSERFLNERVLHQAGPLQPCRPIETGEVDEEGRRDEGVEFVQLSVAEYSGKLLKKQQLVGENTQEIPAQFLHGKRVPAGEIEGAPLFEKDLGGEIDKGNAVKAAGHGAEVVQDATTVVIHEWTGGLIIFWHERFP